MVLIDCVTILRVNKNAYKIFHCCLSVPHVTGINFAMQCTALCLIRLMAHVVAHTNNPISSANKLYLCELAHSNSAE